MLGKGQRDTIFGLLDHRVYPGPGLRWTAPGAEKWPSRVSRSVTKNKKQKHCNLQNRVAC